MKRVVTTLLFLRKPGELLLAMKKRGFGAGKWNGVGGKTEPGETPLLAAIRECQEEIDVTPRNLLLVGRLDFKMTHDPQFNHDCHVFVATKWHGEPAETDEMRPQWFTESEIPYRQMWAADRQWLPLVLTGVRFEARVTFGPDDEVVSADIKELPNE